MREEVAAALSGNFQHRYEVLIRFSRMVTQFKRILIGEICTDVRHVINVPQSVDESLVCNTFYDQLLPGSSLNVSS